MSRGHEEFSAYAAYNETRLLAPYSYRPKPLGDDDVEIAISHCGICGSDLHTIRNGWKRTKYPVVPGHEIVGRVLRKGSKVTNLDIGDRVGVGPQLQSCSKCQECQGGYEQLCSKKVFTYNDTWKDAQGYPTQFTTYGGYADRIRTHSNFAFLIPTKISSAEASSLLCAGVTTFVPLKKHQIGNGHKVCVVGVGGLGHLAIQFASKLGAEVMAVSHSGGKHDDVMKLGAAHFANLSELKTQKFTRSQDIVLFTSSDPNTDLSPYLNLLKNHGTLVLLGLPEVPLEILAFDLTRDLKIKGSLLGGRQDVQDMLEFADKHNVRPWIQTLAMEDVNQGIKAMLDGKARYRIVLENANDPSNVQQLNHDYCIRNRSS